MRIVRLIKVAISGIFYEPGTRQCSFRNLLALWRGMPRAAFAPGESRLLGASGIWFERSVLPARRA